MQHIFPTKWILRDLNHHIVKKEPWSLVRLGDAGTGIISALRAPGVVDRGKWMGDKGKRLASNILGQLTVPLADREKVINMVIESMCSANYIDHYDCFNELNSKKGISVLGEKQDEIHEAVGIDNGGNFCNPFVHYYSIVGSEYNLFNIMKGRRVFCITSRDGIIKKLEQKSRAKIIHSHKIPMRGRKSRHYVDNFDKICQIIKHRAEKYDLFLVGAGLLAVIYCGLIKENGGRAFDVGRLFDFWAGKRHVDSRPKRFISYNTDTMQCRRIRKSKISEVW